MSRVMKFCLQTLFCLLISTPLYSQDFWETLPFPDSINISSLAVNDVGDIFVISRTEVINDGVYLSHDNGITWELNYRFVQSAGGNSISINEEGSIFVLTNNGINNLLISHDNGTSWIVRSIPWTNGTAVTIRAVGPNTLFVSTWGWGATLMRSTDEGLSWEIIYESQGSGAEYISDIVIRDDGVICIGLFGYQLGMGGVYASFDNGLSWEILVPPSHQIVDLEIDAINNLLIADRDSDGYFNGGIYYYNFNNGQINTLVYGPSICGIICDSENEIFAGAPMGILYSNDWETFDYLNSGLPYPDQMGELFNDSQNYLFALLFTDSHYIFRSAEPIVTKTEIILIDDEISIFPNPVRLGSTTTIALNSPAKYLKVYDTSGRILYSVHNIKKEYNLNTTTLPKGLYIIVLETINNIFSQKMVIY